MTFEEIIKLNEGLIGMVINKYRHSLKEYGYEYDDLYQECLMKIYDEYKNYNDDYALSTYLYTILDNYLLNLNKYHSTQKRKNHITDFDGKKVEFKDIKNFDFTRLIQKKEYTDFELYVLNKSYELLKTLPQLKQTIINDVLKGDRQVDIAKQVGCSQQYVSRVFKEFINKIKGEIE